MFKRLSAAGAAALLASSAAAQPAAPFGDGWELRGKAALETHDGRKSLAVESGFGYARGVSFQDGTIEFEVQLTRRRSFVYLMFRMQSDAEYEELYLRPHKSGLPDALQYAPVYQGHSAWQLHHGPGGTAAVAFEPGAWTKSIVTASGLDGAESVVVSLVFCARDSRRGLSACRVSRRAWTRFP